MHTKISAGFALFKFIFIVKNIASNIHINYDIKYIIFAFKLLYAFLKRK